LRLGLQALCDEGDGVTIRIESKTQGLKLGTTTVIFSPPDFVENSLTQNMPAKEFLEILLNGQLEVVDSK
jgi:hypothetical protein